MTSSSEGRPDRSFPNVPAPEGSKAGSSYARFIPRGHTRPDAFPGGPPMKLARLAALSLLLAALIGPALATFCIAVMGSANTFWVVAGFGAVIFF